jgi:hypothetical protein
VVGVLKEYQDHDHQESRRTVVTDRVELKVAAHDWQERFIIVRVGVCFESTVVVE